MAEADRHQPQPESASPQPGPVPSPPGQSDGTLRRPPVPTHRAVSEQPPAQPPRIGEQRPPHNEGRLGYTYTIYRFYDPADRLLYLGESGRLRQRIIDLEVGNPRGLPLGHDDGPKPWWREAVRIELQHLPPGTTEAEAMAEEARQIELERPVYNRRGADGQFDRTRQEAALGHAHFESDVATVEHERHDGVVRDLTQVEIESRRTADRLRPGGSTLLDAVPRQGKRLVDTGADRPATAQQRRSTGRTFNPGRGGESGPGSRLGVVIVAVVLTVAVAAALIASLQAAF